MSDWAVALLICALVLVADALVTNRDDECPQMVNSSSYNEAGDLICKDGRRV